MNCFLPFGGILAPLPGILISTLSSRFRDLSAKPRVYFGAEGVHVQARLEDAAQAGHHCATPEAAIAFAAVIKDCRASTLHENIVRLGFELIGPIRAAFPSPEPRRPDQKSLQAEATTCRDPGSVDCPGFFFVAAGVLSPRRCNRPLCLPCRKGGSMRGTDQASPRYHQGGTMIRIIATIGLLVATVLFLYWLGAFDLPISIARWWIGGHGRR